MIAVAAVFAIVLAIVALGCVLHVLDRLSGHDAWLKALEERIASLDPMTPPKHSSCRHVPFRVSDGSAGGIGIC